VQVILVQPAVQSKYQNRHHRKRISKPKHHTACIVLPIEKIQDKEWQKLVILFAIECTVERCISRLYELRTLRTEILLVHRKQTERKKKRGEGKTAGNKLTRFF